MAARDTVTELDPDRVRENLASVREEIAAAATRAGRDPGDVEVLTAVKYVPVDEIGTLAEAGLTPADVCAIGVGVPGPVEVSTGRPVHPPIMPGWHDHPIPDAFGRYGCPVFADNDVNVMALGEMGVVDTTGRSAAPCRSARHRRPRGDRR